MRYGSTSDSSKESGSGTYRDDGEEIKQKFGSFGSQLQSPNKLSKVSDLLRFYVSGVKHFVATNANPLSTQLEA